MNTGPLSKLYTSLCRLVCGLFGHKWFHFNPGVHICDRCDETCYATVTVSEPRDYYKGTADRGNQLQ